ncbi:Piso0_002467 [Millerozyma farinosa CBS 7064]|uniref:Piso0_002467 protein n=1 Tax=Pichia sorbitophila (strain ATCC MYA-4447 / BCRC 22081 / CBS 7064 / NBRC 10061 / NRRL Y-12695) TaxID=559304 RepID=G8YCP4_PICSO|nr:Piso0_002467 [Millerozyma farinosa CBS 7064]
MQSLDTGNSVMRPQKRPLGLDSEERQMSMNFEQGKRRKHGDFGTFDRRGGSIVRDRFSAPNLHCVPPDMLPIVHSSLKVSGFFTDITTDLSSPEVMRQLDGILRKFPPPVPPHIPNDNSSPDGGIMVPFIYPPPPAIRLQEEAPSEYGVGMQNNTGRDENRAIDFVQIPPLPFPPPNYMPYPLISDKSSLLPEVVFRNLLEASENLPRIDMVVASAAGTLFDLKNQAEQEGFSVMKYEDIRREKLADLKRHIRSSSRESSDYSETSTDGYENSFNSYCEYAAGVDISEEFDPYESYSQSRTRDYRYAPEYAVKFNSRLSDIKNEDKSSKEESHSLLEDEEALAGENASRFHVADTKEILSGASKDASLASGSNKARRREEIKHSLEELEDYEDSHRREIYLSRRNELLTKLKNLRNSKLGYLSQDEQILDEDLLKYKHKLEERRDERLTKLKLDYKYNSIKSALNFYEESNWAFKRANTLMLNKLMKLKNFFEYQKKLFDNMVQNPNSYREGIFDIKSKDSTKIFSGISERDFNYDIKNIIRSSSSELSRGQEGSHSSHQSHSQVPLVHDFMPLYSEEEFNIITGDMPSKFKQNKGSKTYDNVKHQIFQNPLYDPITSGSDTGTTTDNSSGTLKRRGRRGITNDKLIGEQECSDPKLSEGLLLAKIVKHYSGPKNVTQQELVSDFELMGLKSKWPAQPLNGTESKLR